MREITFDDSRDFITSLCEEFKKNNRIDPEEYENYNVKRGLRNSDGTGVMAGITLIGNVRGYIIQDGEREPVAGKLIYRGIDVEDIVKNVLKDKRFGFEEVCYLLLFGSLPDAEQLSKFDAILSKYRGLPANFTEDMILRAPSGNIMNKLARAVLALYSYDSNPEDNMLSNILRQSIELIARFPCIIAHAYAAKVHYYDKNSLILHYPQEELSTAENFLYMIRTDGEFTEEEARLLDLSLILHAEHGGGNNSAFACRVLSSSNTDTYSAISAAVGSLKGSRHGGANLKVMEMFEGIKKNVKDWTDAEEVYTYLLKILRREAGDGSGLIYGMGHAVYTISDPRTRILKEQARHLAAKNGMDREFALMQLVEDLSPKAFEEVKGTSKMICANVDFYSGMVYRILKLPQELYTAIFAMARIAGWAAHRIEEVMTGGRIIRPAYKSVVRDRPYISLADR